MTSNRICLANKESNSKSQPGSKKTASSVSPWKKCNPVSKTSLTNNSTEITQNFLKNGQNSISRNLEQRISSMEGKGRPLQSSVRRSMEPAIGKKMDNVRVYTDSRAGEMTKELGATAFTHGRDIFFDRGEYNPHTSAGTTLLAHELAHVVQQTLFEDNSVTVRFYTYCGYDEEQILRHTDVYQKGRYSFDSKDYVVAVGTTGYRR